MKKIYHLYIFDSPNRFRDKINMAAKAHVMAPHIIFYLFIKFQIQLKLQFYTGTK